MRNSALFTACFLSVAHLTFGSSASEPGSPLTWAQFILPAKWNLTPQIRQEKKKKIKPQIRTK